MDGIFYSKDNIINNFEYWQKYDPFKRTYEDTFFKTCVKKGRTTYLQQVFPSKDFMENTELLESTELVVCKLRVQKILSDKTGKDISEIEKDTERDYYLNASDALEYGLVDKIL